MRTRNILLERLETVAEGLGPDVGRIVFVGGAVTSILVESEKFSIRSTADVDCIGELSRPAYYALTERLRERGFTECTDPGSPLCRYVFKGIPVDIVPASSNVLGFSNGWYPEAIVHAVHFQFASGRTIKVIAPLYFLATKLEAFEARGLSDLDASHDLEDILTVLAASEQLRSCVQNGYGAVENFVRGKLAQHASSDIFLRSIPSHFEGDDESQDIARELVLWLQALSQQTAYPT